MSRIPPPPFGATLDDDEQTNIPPPPEGATLDQRQGGPASDIANAPRLPSLGMDSVVSARDGDTLRISSGASIRLPGVDAPELRQQGWDRRGLPIPIGQQSQQWISDAVKRATASIGQPVGQSYGRTVAPVTIDGQDLGQTAARFGQALAAPRYLPDPQQRFQTMQAERLARLNGLGVHDTMFQPPEQYRRAPMPAPSRETVAQFWDTPTPMAGLRPEDEQTFLGMANDLKVPVAQVVQYARDHGFTVDPANVERSRAAVAKSGIPAAAEYRDRIKPLTDLGDGALGAGVRGFGSGALAGGLDEVGAFADTMGLTPGRESVWNSDRRIVDVWANNRDQNAAILGYDDFAHPWATLGGEVAGGLAVPFGARAKTVPELFRVGAAYGGAGGFLGTEGDIGQRAIGAAVGVPVGGALGAGAGKALEGALRYAPRLRQVMASRIGSRTPEGSGAPVGSIGDELGEDAFIGVNRSRLEAAEEAFPLAEDATGFASRQAANEWHNSVPDGWNEFRREGSDRFLTYKSGDGSVASVHVNVDDNGVAQISIDPFSRDANRFGPAQVRQAARDLQQLYPEIRSFTGERQSGAMPGRTQTMDMAGDPGASVSSEPRQRDYIDLSRPIRMDQPLSEAQVRTMTDRIDPRDVVPIPSNEVGSVEEAANIAAGRYVEAKPPNERAELTRQTVRGINGPVPKVGPVDLVGWLRLNGGLRDQGGELAHMGLGNAARKMDFAGQEGRFGPLVHENGRTFDDAAQAAWEAGYFPELSERPDINTFLDALRGTHEGWSRRFLPDDQPELDRFYATQAERYDLEQQRYETGQPVWQDKSVPANEPQPFPPVQAYEEWPAGGPDFAGNIDLRKLESPQDISRALSTLQSRVGFDAATRGRVAHAETERLAADLNMTPETLLSRRRGQAFNAEEALAARQLLAKSGNELVNAAKRVQALETPGDDVLADFQEKLLRHVGIQEAVAGMTAEAGRSLQQFRMAANSRSVRGEVLASLVNSGGGAKRIRDAADALLDAVEGEPGKFNVLADKLSKPRWIDKAIQLRYFMLLSGPQTHAANLISNTMTALGQIPEHAMAAGLGYGRRAVMGSANASDRVYGSEIGARAFGLLQGWKEGMTQFVHTMRTGETSDFFGKVEGPEINAIGGVAGKIARTPTRLLSAEDELFKAMARRMELNGLAARKAASEGLRGDAASKRIAELTANPPDDMIERAFDYGRYLTFQEKLTGIPEWMSRGAQSHPSIKFFVPFVRTPTNLLKFAAERSPIAWMVRGWRQDIAAGGARRDLALAKAMIGTGVGMWAADLARNGIITGAPPEDENKARILRADGWQPYSIRVGDQYVSYQRLDPFAFTLSTAADLATKADGMTERQADNAAGMIVASLINAMGDKTFFSGVSDLFTMLQDPERNLGSYSQNQAASLVVPAGVAQLARTVDPVRRDTRSVGEEIQSRIPFASQSLYPQRDIWGAPISTQRLGPDLVSPITTTNRLNDPINAEMLRSGAVNGRIPRYHTVGGKRVDYTAQEYDRLTSGAGKAAHANVAAAMAAPGWGAMAPAERAKQIAKVIASARRETRGTLSGSVAPAAPRKAPVPPPPPPPGAVIDGEAGGVNVFADLQKAIPGIRFTSGFRTPEYQADMRRRGYKPADNSGHLSGSDFDMLPPPDKSLDWLKAAVAKAQPGARLSIHDGHLHGSFPGYYGAPVLGGAKAAGLRNPLIGMPPPPPGATLDR